ncbi:hypothetical protein L2E82_39327 [Cichorium intybus]|uniref:Uncharacterized protein n=1 Tax=Cichorium intybus TaxID=13427 RepID=A0ACB9AJN2_CICIN|nr:hypothetical protein L2E82_39327 [Cichorium intybus]
MLRHCLRFQANFPFLNSMSVEDALKAGIPSTGQENGAQFSKTQSSFMSGIRIPMWILRLDNLILDTITNMKDPLGSNRASIIEYIETSSPLLTKAKIDAEFEKMKKMTHQQATAFAVKAVAEVEAAIYEAKMAAKEAEVAEADAELAKVFAMRERRKPHFDYSDTETGFPMRYVECCKK